MIVSERHQLIVLHCRKAAGSSLCVSLARLLGPQDLQISALPETMALGIPLTRRVQRLALRQSSYLLPFWHLLGPRGYRRAVTRAVDHAHRPLLGRKPPHAPAVRVASAFPREWASFHKLAVVRNPWDRTVSDYFWRIQHCRKPPSFASYVQALVAGDDLNGIVPLAFHDNWPMYTIDGQVVADTVVRFEQLQQGLEGCFASIGLPWDGWLPRSKGGHRPAAASGDYRSFYTPGLERLVGALYCREIDQFGYRF
ncbi:MAG: sulfotransferase family 2 domain-containing protein [Cyanobacteriota bacterium]|nr:sulfotransferase family 2 domain-containing protein [Cyanobacteriota bacterium]